jgi:predicted Ser/Thr protein kinase
VKVIIVAANEKDLGDWGHRTKTALKSVLPFHIDVSGLLAESLVEDLEEADIFILGPDLRSKAAALARRIKESLSLARIIVCITDDIFSTGEFRSLREGDVYKVLPESAAEEDLQKEILSIRFDAILSTTQTNHSGVIAGRYEVVRCLGSGSMGMVYACRHRELGGHMVAVKVLFPQVAKDAVAAERFRNEIFAAYGVSHPHVVRAYEYLKDGDLIAWTMEYVGGGNLAEVLDQSENIQIERAIRILTQVCSGVQAIHDAGIVHRNLKPENILLTEQGDVKIADFCCAVASSGSKLTEEGGVSGSIDYVTPEYMINGKIDQRSDIYGIGILAYEIITGKSPFVGDTVYATMTKRLESDPAAPSTIRADCPELLDNVVLKAMAKDPEERYQSAAAMQQAMEAINAS